MFALIESAPAPRQGVDWVPRAASFAAHAALIAAAVLATQRAITVATPGVVITDVYWQAPAPPDLPASPGTPVTATTTTPAPLWTLLPVTPLHIPTEIPPPGTSELLPGGEAVPGLVIGNPPGGHVVPGFAPLDAHLVEEQPVMLGHPAIRYPEILRQAGIEGRVLVEAVLDTLGRAEPGSLRITESPNPLFDREALTVVAGSRYRPGRVDGRAVRVRIQVPVAFSIRR